MERTISDSGGRRRHKNFQKLKTCSVINNDIKRLINTSTVFRTYTWYTLDVLQVRIPGIVTLKHIIDIFSYYLHITNIIIHMWWVLSLKVIIAFIF